MSMVSEKHIHPATPERSYAGRNQQQGPHVPRLGVVVVATSDEGTLIALRTAGKLAAILRAHITLVKTQIVPFALPLDSPPVSIDFLRWQLYGLVCEAGIEAEEITIQLWLCRDGNKSLREILLPRSLVVMGGRKRWWSRRERTLERYLSRLNHQVVFVDLDAKGTSETPCDLCANSVFHSEFKKVDTRRDVK
jgi:hypothetical protein